jgi:hypothetical protein
MPMSIKNDLTDKTVAPLGIGPSLYFPQSQDALSLSPQQRWELTRRHPYYLRCWTWARSYHQWKIARLGLGPNGTNWELAEAAAGVLRRLGVRIDGMNVPDPSLSWDEQPVQMRDNNGASAMTARELALQLLARLPDDARRMVGKALQEDTAVDAAFAVNKLLDENLDKAQLDMVMYPPSAPGKTILPAVAKIVEHAKDKETRPRPDAVDDQIKVWDAREGWTGIGYDGRQELRLRDIAIKLDTPMSTVKDRYKRAFQLITGRPFSTELWAILLLSMKLQSSVRKLWRTRNTRRKRTDVALARLPRRRKTHDDTNDAPKKKSSDTAAPEPVTTDAGQVFTDFNAYLNELLGQGKSIEEVIQSAAVEFGFTPTGSEEKTRFIKYITKVISRLE